jgi:hypothetical protein
VAGTGVSEPITDVHVMAGLRNRYRPLVVDAPVALGFLTVGDAPVCTNPLYGRGCSLALVHRSGSRTPCANTATIRSRWRVFAGFTERELVPWFRTAVFQDEQARMQAAEKSSRPRIAGVRAEHLPRRPAAALRTSPIVFRVPPLVQPLEHARRADE